ncbi:MAG: Ig-like domain-containing protein [Clostridia bacterium]|nr:Ig-like domain-containing protein [Clostridia bacterium]
MENREFTDTLPKVEPLPDTHFHFETVDTGFNVYCPVKGRWGYRYAPSIMYYPDGTMDAWFATPGTAGEWDWFTYKHSDDGGKTWSEEKLVLQPTPDSMDHYSVCDPGVIYFGGYYYIGYTSTIVSTNGGINNNIFVARSRRPDGPFDKWNGSGWGGDPQPIIYYNESDDKWGAGEPSFVVLDDTLYIYYTWACDNGDYKYVSIADATDPNWPATIQFKGRAFTSGGGDQVDVVYVEDAGLFLGVQTAQRFTVNSGIQLWESKDGIHFIKGEFIKKNIAQLCHNMGISKRSNGHVQLKDNLMLGFAFASGTDGDYWGKWATRFVFINLTTYQGEVAKNKGDKNILFADSFWPPLTDPKPEGLTTTPHLVKLNVGTTYNDLVVKWVDSTITTHAIEGDDIKNITFSDYDKSVIEFDGTAIKGLKEGKTTVKASYMGFSVVFKVYVYPEGFLFDQRFPAIESVTAVEPELVLYNGKSNGGSHKAQVRGLVKFVDDTWGEVYNDSTEKHPDYPAMVPSEHYPVVYTSSDTSIATVSKDGMVSPKGIGECTVTAQVGSDQKNTFTVKIIVREVPDEFSWKDADFKW